MVLAPELGELVGQGWTPPTRWPLTPTAYGPGIYRHAHASVLIRSRESAVLVDPIGLATSRFRSLRRSPWIASDEPVDAVLITHTHNDHWDLPSILSLAGAPHVIVPRVPKANLLAPEAPLETLSAIGASVQAPSWGIRVLVGDIEIDVLPFYGEQPTRDAPGPSAEQRNWGNCYRVTTPDFSALVLADSGADPAGDMAQVIEASRVERGSVDVLLACARRFACPFFGGLDNYWATLPFWRTYELFGQWRSGVLPDTTAGPMGVAHLCRVAGARYYAPYAHGFSEVGVAIADIGWGGGESAESEVAQLVQRLLCESGAATQVISWNPGDALVNLDGSVQRLTTRDGGPSLGEGGL